MQSINFGYSRQDTPGHCHRPAKHQKRQESQVLQWPGPGEPTGAGEAQQPGRPAGGTPVPTRSGHPRRAGLPAVLKVRRPALVPPDLQALRANVADHHHQPDLRRMAPGIW